jgi:uncharacterized protein YbcC (UPF0753/DUF2309 family)
MIVSSKEILHINALIENAVDLFHNFWPMTGFIHHNPLHGFESMHFEEAVLKAQSIFHSRPFLPRERYRKFMAEGKIEREDLDDEILRYCRKVGCTEAWFPKLLYGVMVESDDAHRYDLPAKATTPRIDALAKELGEGTVEPERPRERLGRSWTLYDAVDALYDLHIGERLDEKVSKVAMRHLDEGQAAWEPADKEQGMFRSWRRLIVRDRLFFDPAHPLCRLMTETERPEDIIYWVMTTLGIPEELWENYFTMELGKLHGWTGFMRWRSLNASYRFQKTAPAYLEELLAIRLYFSYMFLRNSEGSIGFFPDFETLSAKLDEPEGLLRARYYAHKMLPAFVEETERLLENGEREAWLKLYVRYIEAEWRNRCRCEAEFLDTVLRHAPEPAMEPAELLQRLKDFEKYEGFIWQRAMERHYMKSLMGAMAAEAVSPKRESKPAAQLFFCIDVRSETIRRHIEASGDYETFGIAGFFGIPLKLIDVHSKYEADYCPAVIKPKNIVYKFAEAKKPSLKLKRALRHIYHDLKYNVVSPYITVETIGILFGFDFFGKTLWPNLYMPLRKKLLDESYSGRLIIEKFEKAEVIAKVEALQKALIVEAVKEQFSIDVSHLDEEVSELRRIAVSREPLLFLQKGRVEPKTKLGISIGLMHHEEIELLRLLQEEYRISYKETQGQIDKLSKVGFTFKEQLFYAENALRMCGLVKAFAPFVVLCGHESHSENNPYESALDCGACGGKSSETNARVLAYILNKPDIREALSHKGIAIGEETLFCYAVHNTVTDRVQIATEGLPDARKKEIEALQRDLDRAADASSMERIKTLPFGRKLSGKKARRFIERNQMDWSQTRPEWGLSKNHSFIIGPREESRGIALENRTFLQSYDYRLDPKGHLLEVILSSPLVVGEWINLEHFFSAVDNRAFGSESKVYHNVVGRLGVITGNMSDLRTGLAAQSLFIRGEHYHEPIRLISIVVAPFERYRRVIDRVRKVSELVYNEWVKMIFMDPQTRSFHYYCCDLEQWVEIGWEEARRWNNLEQKKEM